MTGDRIGIRGSAPSMLGALIALAGWAALPAPAHARVFVGIGVGVPFPGYGYPLSAAIRTRIPIRTPPAYYPPPPPAYYPGAYAPPVAGPGAPAARGTRPPAITYTERPAFTNAAGQTCREFKTAQNTLGTACQDGRRPVAGAELSISRLDRARCCVDILPPASRWREEIDGTADRLRPGGQHLCVERPAGARRKGRRARPRRRRPPGDCARRSHLARHPFGKVPAFEHDEFALYETQAIMRYVDEALSLGRRCSRSTCISSRG